MKCILLLLILIAGCSEKESDEPEIYRINCNSELIKDDIQNLTCKVAKFNDTIFILTYDSISFLDSGYYAGSESILVPSGLPDSLKIPEIFVNVSGQIVKDCCNLLTLPQIRGGFGCKFYITKIQKIDYHENLSN